MTRLKNMIELQGANGRYIVEAISESGRRLWSTGCREFTVELKRDDAGRLLYQVTIPLDESRESFSQ